jgi:hypothetical protein
VCVQDLCHKVEQQLEGNVWLPVSLFPALGSSSTSSSSVQAASNQIADSSSNWKSSSSSTSLSSDCGLVYQVVVDRQAGVLGVQPCNALAAEHFAGLPLTAGLRGPALKAAQEG